MYFKDRLVLLIIGMRITVYEKLLFVNALTSFFDLERLTTAQLCVAHLVGFAIGCLF